jgi:hypothetical protein
MIAQNCKTDQKDNTPHPENAGFGAEDGRRTVYGLLFNRLNPAFVRQAAISNCVLCYHRYSDKVKAAPDVFFRAASVISGSPTEPNLFRWGKAKRFHQKACRMSFQTSGSAVGTF